MKWLTGDNQQSLSTPLHLHLLPSVSSPPFSLSLQNIIAEHEIRNISCAAQDPEDLSTFAYITKDLKSSHHYCHVFTAFDVVSTRTETSKQKYLYGHISILTAVCLHPLVRTWRMRSSWHSARPSRWPTSWPCKPGRAATDRPHCRRALTASPANLSPNLESTSANL